MFDGFLHLHFYYNVTSRFYNSPARKFWALWTRELIVFALHAIAGRRVIKLRISAEISSSASSRTHRISSSAGRIWANGVGGKNFSTDGWKRNYLSAQRTNGAKVRPLGYKIAAKHTEYTRAGISANCARRNTKTAHQIALVRFSCASRHRRPLCRIHAPQQRFRASACLRFRN